MTTASENGYELLVEMIQGLATSIAVLDARLSSLETKFDAMYEFMVDKFTRVDERLDKLEQSVTGLKVAVLDMQEDMVVMGRAQDKDSKTILSHEKRIGRLEKVQKFA
jgi:hypothetical protein